MAYVSNVPQSGQSLGASRPIINENFVEIEAAQNVDHVDFNEVGQGQHQKVTQPDTAVLNIPSTDADQCVMYAYTPIAATGSLQWSRGESDAIPTPITSLHGNIATLTGGVGSAQTILNFSGAGDCLCTFTLTGVFNAVKFLRSTTVAFDGTEIIGPLNWAYELNGAANAVLFNISGSTSLQIYTKGTATDVVWTLEFKRFQV